jgi:hypothetical protein
MVRLDDPAVARPLIHYGMKSSLARFAIIDKPSEFGAKILAVDDPVDEPVLQ